MLALPIRSVSVKADLRAYEHPVMISGKALASLSASQIDRRRDGRLRGRQIGSIAGVATPWANTDTLLVVAERSA